MKDDEKLDRIAEGVARIDQKTDGLKEYVQAVSANVREVRLDLAAHKEDVEAHGAKAGRVVMRDIVGWIGLGIAIVTAAVEFVRAKP